MSEQKINPIIRFFPSLNDVAFVLPLVMLFGFMQGSKVLLGDGDTGWHIRTGEWILKNGRVPDSDFFSFTKPGEPWFAWEWLWDAAFGWLHLHWGMAAVLLASTLVLCATSGLLFRLVRRSCPNDFVAIAVTGLAVGASSIHWLARPHLFTLLFTVIFYSVLEATRERPARAAWSLVPLTVLWTNLHGGFLAGLIFILAYAAGEFAGALFPVEPGRRKTALARGGIYVLIAAGCLAASLANPYGYLLHVHIYHYLRDPFLFDHIVEFFPVNFRGSAAVMYELMFALAAVAAYRCVARREFGRALLVVGWAHLALFSQRNIPLFAFAAAPPVAAMIADWVRRKAAAVEKVAAEFSVNDRIPRLRFASAAAVAVVAALLFAPAPPKKFRAEFDAKRYPAGAIEYFKSAGMPRALFTDDEWGDYLIYRLHPLGGQVFVDGRSDFYGAKFDEAYLDVLAVKWGWERTLGRYGVDAILLPVGAPLAGALKESRRWRAVYDDGVAIVFQPASNRDQAIAKTTTQITIPTQGGDHHVEEFLARR